MKKVHTILIIALILPFIMASKPLHYFVKSTHHMTVEEQKQTYIDTLNDLHNDLRSIVQSMREVKNQVDGNITSADGHQNLERVVYDTGMDKLRNKMKIIKESIPEIEKLRTWECKNLTQGEIDLLQEQLSQLQNQASLLKENQLSDCERDHELSHQIQKIENSINILNSELSNTCSPPKQVFFISNLGAVNADTSKYVYGDQTQEEYQEEIDKLKSSNLVASCPQQIPFVVENECVFCDFYDIQEGKCIQQGCQEAAYYDSETHSCVQKERYTDLNTESPYVYGSDHSREEFENVERAPEKSLACPEDTPFDDSENNCIACSEGEVFELFSKACIECPEETQYYEEGHICRNVLIGQCQNQENHYWNGTGCVHCSQPGVFQNNQCVCPDDHFYHWEKMECRPNNELCEDESHYWSGSQSKCLACEEPGTFNFETETCVCPQNYGFNFEVQKCLEGDGTLVKLPNIEVTNDWVYGDNGQEGYDQALQSSQGSATIKCPEDKPFPNENGECVSCENQQIYDMTSKNCIHCSQSTHFDEVTHRCISCQEAAYYDSETHSCVQKERYTDLNTESPYVYGSDHSREEFENVERAPEKSLACPEDAPFEDSENDCIACSEGEVFELFLKKCISCPEETQYYEEDHICKSREVLVVFPTVEKCQEQENHFWNGTGCVKCEQPGNFQNIQCVCPQGLTYSWSQHVCRQKSEEEDDEEVITCPENSFYNGSSCIKCEQPGVWDFQTSTCTCLQNQFYSFEEQNCQNQKMSTVVPSKDEEEQMIPCDGQYYYHNKTVCIKCEQPGKWNFQRSVCLCPINYHYSQTQEVCIENPFKQKNSNEGAINFSGQRPSLSDELETCPEQAPFFNGQACVQCASPQYFDFSTNQCVKCQDGSIFKAQSQKCEPEIEIYNSLLNEDNNYCCGAPKYTEGKPSCPQDAPFFNSIECVSCKIPQYFNFKAQTCEECPQDESFDTTIKKCEPVQEREIKYKSYISESDDSNQNYIGTPEILAEQDGVVIKSCSQHFPFYNGKTCIACSDPKYFDFSIKKCLQCKQGYFFNSIDKKCSKPLKKYNSILKSRQNYVGKTGYDVQLQDCSEETPYFDGNVCIACLFPKYFDFQSQQCLECEEDTYFNIITHQCEQQTVSKITNLNNANIIYSGEYQKLTQYYSAIKEKNSELSQCPEETPYFVHNTDKCIKCTSDTPIFNINTEKCVKCRDDSYYDSEKHACMSNSVDPQIERMWMNTNGMILD